MPRPIPTAEEFFDRFLSSIEFKANACWEWLRGKDKDGYGKTYYKKKTPGAHRVSYELFNGEFDLSLHVLHTCDNPSCVNPAHLVLGTNDDNVADKMKKGRHKWKAHPKLTKDQVNFIRTSSEKQRKLSEIFGVVQSQISRIRTGKRWKQIGGDIAALAS